MLEHLPHWKSWLNLCKIAPALNRLHQNIWYSQKPPPRRMSNAAFLQLAACFDDPTTRAALRQLIVNLLKDRDPVTRAALREIILEVIKDDLAALLIEVMNER